MTEKGNVTKVEVTGTTARGIGEVNQKTTQLQQDRTGEYWQSIVESIRDGFWVLDREWCCTYINHRQAELIGLPKEEILGKKLSDVLPDTVGTEFYKQLHQAVAKQIPVQFDYFCSAWQRWFEIRVYPSANGASVLTIDITERKQVAEALRESEQHLKVALQTAKLGSWQHDLVTGILSCSEQCKANFGLPPDAEFSHQTLFAALHPDDRDRVQAVMGQAIKERTDYEVEERCFWPDGSLHWLIARGRLIDDADGTPIRMVGVTLDITERKRTEKALQESQELFESFMNHSPVVAFIKDETGRHIYVNALIERLFQREQGNLIGKTDFEIYPLEAAQQFRVNDLKVLRSGRAIQFLETILLEDGEHHFMSFKFPFRDASGHLLLAGMAIDVSDRIRAEKALKMSEERFRLAARAVTGVVYDWDVQTGSVYRSEGLHGLIGVHPEDIPQTREWWLDRIHPDDLARFQEMKHSMLDHSGDCYDSEYRVRHEDGRWIDVWDRGYLIRDQNGQLIRIVGSTADISDRKRAEQQREELLERERKAREQAEVANRIKDEFLTVLSHELRSPLNPILGWAKLLQTRKFDEQATNRALATIERNAKLQVQLIEDLLDVSRILRGKMVLDVRPVNLAATIEAALETVRLAATSKGIQLQVRIAPNMGLVSGDSTRLQQVVWNLFSNAIKFTPSGGRVDVRLEQNASHAQILVSDTGKGIKPEFLPYVFEYFRQEDGKTTRQFGGLGLGLAIVRHLVELHGGTVQAESQGEGQGATFTVKLPLTAIAKETDRDGEQLSTACSLSQLGILVVDDEADMRELLMTILEQYGAQVKVAASAAEALRVLEQFKLDVLISDIGMPEVDGYMLMRQVRRLPPEQGGLIQAIALTAYAGELSKQQALEAGFQRHLPKPTDPSELVQTIAALISRSCIHLDGF